MIDQFFMRVKKTRDYAKLIQHFIKLNILFVIMLINWSHSQTKCRNLSIRQKKLN